MTPSLKPLLLALAIVALLATIWVSATTGFSLDPNVICDRTVSPAYHALEGIQVILPKGEETYCIYAETLSRGKPVDIGVHYRIPVNVQEDRFGSTEYHQSGRVFTTDNTHVVNETITIPANAVDAIITVSYQYYIDTNKMHLVVKKCGNRTEIKTEKIKSGFFEVASL